MNQKQIIISVFGGRQADKDQLDFAYKIGQLLALKNWVCLCGGKGGVMEAVSRGCSLENGIVIGILPGKNHAEGNPYLTLSIPTGIGFARNEILACACDGAIAIGGKYGTLSEVGHTMNYNKPYVSCFSWDIPGGFVASTPEMAIEILEREINKERVK